MRKALAVLALLLALPLAVQGKAAPSFFHDVAPMRDFYSLRRPATPAVAPEIDLVDPDPFNGQAGAGASPGAGASGGGNGSGGSFDNTVNPIQPAYGAKWDVKFEGDCTFNSSTTVVCPAGNFTAADIGKIEFGTAGTTQVNPNMVTAAGLVVPQGTITGVTNATTVTVSTTASGNCTPSSTVACSFAWGTQDDTTPINNATTAAWGNGNSPCVLQLPAGTAFFSGPILNSAPSNRCMGIGANNGALSDITIAGPVVYGQGPAATVLIPLPTFNFAGCIFGTAANACIAGVGNLFSHDFGINGLQQTQPAGSNGGVVLFEAFGQNGGGQCDGGTTSFNLSFSGWGLKSTNSVGFKFGARMCNDSTMWNINVSAFGSTPCYVTGGGGNVLNAYGLFCFGAFGISPVGNALEIDGTNGGIFNSFGGMYLSPLSTGNGAVHCLVTGSGMTFNSWGENFGSVNGTPAQTNGVICNTASATLNFHNANIFVPSGTTGASQVFALGGGNIVHLDHTIVNGNAGANNHLFTTAATDKVFDDCGNTYTAGAVGNTFAGPLFGSCSITGTALTTGNVGLTSNWGTSSVASVAVGSDSHRGRFTITGAAGVATPTLTLTFPTPFLVAPASCTMTFDSAGAFTDFTNVTAGTPTTTSVVFTFTGTSTAVSIVLDYQCGP
jgi:hypothetical protein